VSHSFHDICSVLSHPTIIRSLLFIYLIILSDLYSTGRGETPSKVYYIRDWVYRSSTKNWLTHFAYLSPNFTGKWTKKCKIWFRFPTHCKSPFSSPRFTISKV